MGLTVSANHNTVFTDPSVKNSIIDFETDLPVRVEFETFGKGKFDTQVDKDGNILQDKHILIDGVCIDGIWVKKWYIESRLFQPIGSNYFGQNGTYWFEIPYIDIMDFWLDTLITT